MGEIHKSKVRRRRLRRIIVRYAIISIMAIAIIVGIVAIVINFINLIKKDKSVVQQKAEPVVEELVEAWETAKAQKLPQVNGTIKVMLDPGHGGSDPGTLTELTNEKDITLLIARYVKEYLEETGVTVQLTRTKDTFIDKYQRAELANEQHADLFVSIHCNFLEDRPDISGIETYYLDGMKDGERLANLIHQSVLRVTGANDKYVRTNDYVVIRETNMTAVLIETGYLSNKEDEKQLRDSKYQQQLAYGIAAGIVEYLNQEGEQ